LADALKPRDDRNRTTVERLSDSAGRDVHDSRATVRRRGDDPGLTSGERPCLVAQVADRHCQERHRDSLARGEQHVQFAPGWQW
jgi:hypothetical protein